MATNARHGEQLGKDLMQITNVKTDLNCVNCASIQKQLHHVLSELKSAETIISLLREDVKHRSSETTVEFQYPNSQRVNSECESRNDYQMSEKWSSVVSRNSKIKVLNDPKTLKQRQQLISTNRFEPLTTLTDNQEVMVHESNCNRTQSKIRTRETTSTQHTTGGRIPTIVNGRIVSSRNYNHNKNPTKKSTDQSCAPKQKSTKFVHKVDITGDSHLRGLAVKVNQYLNTKFKVCSLIKPGASIHQLVSSQTADFKCLNKSDAIVINGGTNDLDKCNDKVNGILISMGKFIQEYSNTNIVIVNTPLRYDLMNLDKMKMNMCIQAYNYKLKNMLKSFKHVTLVEMNTDRRYYTRHGLHLNSQGKEWLAKQIAKKIELLIEIASKVNPAIPLKWLDEPASLINSINSINRLTSDSNTSEGMIPTSQAIIYTRRTSNRNKKVPITMSNDFLWRS
jgi:hypothetical protein